MKGISNEYAQDHQQQKINEADDLEDSAKAYADFRGAANYVQQSAGPQMDQ